MDDPGTVAVRLGLYIVLGLAFGLPLFAWYSARGAARLRLRGWMLGIALIGLILSGLGLAFMAAAMTGGAIADLDRATLSLLLFETPVGAAIRVRAVALVACGIIALSIAPRFGLPLAALAGGTALATLAWGGHGAASDGMIHLAADIAHMLAAGAWTGALLGLLLLIVRAEDGRVLLGALQGFALTGTVIVGLIVGTGVANMLFILGIDGLATIPFTLYGQLLVLKLLLFAAMLGMAAANRFRLVPALERSGADPSAAMRMLKRSIAIETGFALAVLACVAWLGTLSPLPS